jgi:hypothetical protein
VHCDDALAVVEGELQLALVWLVHGLGAGQLQLEQWHGPQTTARGARCCLGVAVLPRLQGIYNAKKSKKSVTRTTRVLMYGYLSVLGRLQSIYNGKIEQTWG